MRNGVSRVVILSGDTDVFVLAMYFIHLFVSNGMKKLWFRGGIGDKTRYVPMHVLAHKIGQSLCEVLPAVHALTGSDMTSKFGTKAASLKCNPTVYLQTFGKIIDDVDDNLVEAEKYLVQV